MVAAHHASWLVGESMSDRRQEFYDKVAEGARRLGTRFNQNDWRN